MSPVRVCLFSVLLSFAVFLPAQAGSIQGAVHGPAGKPLAGAVVTVLEAGDRSLTNADGQYYLPNIPAGRLTVVATCTGYLPFASAVTVQKDGITAKAFTLAADKVHSASLGESLPTKRPAVAESSVITAAQWQPPLVTDTGPVEEGWRITAMPSKSFYLPFEPIKVNITLTNISTTDLYIDDSSSAFDFDFAVFRGNVEMPATEYGAKRREEWIAIQKRSFSGGGPPRFLFGPLHPGQVRGYQFVVNRSQDMTLDGSYTIIVKREPNSTKQLVADPVQVEVGVPNLANLLPNKFGIR